MTKFKFFFLWTACLLNAATALAQTWEIGYPNKNDVTATLNGETLTITGTGEMRNYDYESIEWDYDSYMNKIKTIVIEEGVTSIGNYAFYYLQALTSISIPNSVTRIGYSALRENCNLTEITIPEGVKSIESDLPERVKTVNFNAIECNSAWFPGDVTTVNIGDKVTIIPYGAFAYCNKLTSINMPASVTRIEKKAFEGCSFTEITIPQNVTYIGDEAFYRCGNLTEITIPENVTSIGLNAFDDCDALKTMNFNAINCTFNGGTSSYSLYITTVNIGDKVTAIPSRFIPGFV